MGERERDGTGLNIKIAPLVIAFGFIINSLKSKSQPQSALLFCPGAQLHKLSLLLTYAQYMSIIKCSRTIAILLESLRSQRKKSPNLLASQRMARGLYQKSHSQLLKKHLKRPKTLASSSRHVMARARIFSFKIPKVFVSQNDQGMQTHFRLHCHGI